MPEGIARRRLRVYVAGPISTGDRLMNVHNATWYGRQMVRDGLAPYIPHLDAFMLATDEDISWNAYLEWDLEWVAQSECVFRLPGISNGADLEVARATALGIPVFRVYDELLAFAANLGLNGVRK